ncbi:MAG: tyrosine--tRNA ligase [Candidatus Zambryskibacteria bacterium RIFCSPLOWO2_01_FULL_43_17]|uniref:Tyrosine--tRNA ligase n=1 Tax=Candidatus Zambryskibacteria bacterium RIFCSPLOWO2_01_FULL_43_17 TaxID=1802760 RepID=A0A1G2U5Z4_9BACT|nr:MAG: tyrosine--tRNA ligase [Candidatus Zambryskibacteria bacterium RIFCSPLOWO2_01_FULL_43_17]
MKRYDELYLKRSVESLKGISTSEILGFIKPKIETALTWEELEEKLNRGKTLNIKLGIDPTGAELHFGHLVPVMLLDLFLRAEHHIDLVIGDFTARVGDPSGRETARVPLTIEQILNNFSSYKKQISPYIDTSAITLRRNSEWLEKMNLSDFFSIIQNINLGDATQREDFRARAKNAEGVSLAEACYGVLMGIDSLNLETDIELGGLDQLLNFNQCRKVLEISSKEKEVALTTPILEGTAGDGRKMSKSFGNYVALDATNEDKFGKIMSIPDNLMFSYFASFAPVMEKESDELKAFIEENPLEAKKQLATFIVALGSKELSQGEAEREKFERKFSKKEITEDDVIEIIGGGDETHFEVLSMSEYFESKSELRRLFEQGAVVHIKPSGEDMVLDLDTVVSEAEGIVRVGKRRFFKISIK